MLRKLRGKSISIAILVMGLCCGASQARAQSYVVDCSGTNPSAQFTSISAALANTGNGGYVYVLPGTCNEDVTIYGLNNVSVGAFWGTRVSLNGSISVSGSANLYLYGFDVVSPNRTGNTPHGIAVSDSENVTIDACTSQNNPGNGLRVSGNASVYVSEWGIYDNNGDTGIRVSDHSYVSLVPWGGTIDISGNLNSGVYLDRSVVENLGNVSIMNNRTAPGSTLPNGFGIDSRGAATGFAIAIFGPVTIANNHGGGVSLQENSEMSFGGDQSWAPSQVVIQGNGSIGVSAGFGSQVTMFGGVDVTGHSAAGVDLYANSQLYMTTTNQVTHNGFGTDAGKAGIRVDGNSEAYLRNGVIAQNGGPGVVALVNSSVDAVGVSLNSNAGGSFACDASGVITGDMTPSSLGPANNCRIPGNSGIGHRFAPPSGPPDWHAQKAVADRFKAVGAKIRH